MTTRVADSEDPRTSAEVIVAALSDAQVQRYTGSRDRAAAITLVTRERRSAGGIRPSDAEVSDRLRQEASEARAAVDDSLGRVWAAWQHLSGALIVISGWAFLGSGLLAILLGLVTGSFTQVFRAWDGWRWRFDEVGTAVGALLTLSTLGLTVAVLVITAGAITGALRDRRVRPVALRDRRVRPVLLDWAVQRPGQLGRGLPGLEGSGTTGSVVRTVLWIVLAVGAVVAAFGIPVAAVTLLTSLLGFELEWFLTCLAFFAGSVLLGWAMIRLMHYLARSGRIDEQRRVALVWRWSRAVGPVSSR